KVGAVGLDVFEGEGDYFYEDRSGAVIADDALARLFTFPNVIITGHQAYFTQEALNNIAHTTMENIQAYVSKSETKNRQNRKHRRQEEHEDRLLLRAPIRHHVDDGHRAQGRRHARARAANRLSVHNAQLATDCEGIVIFVNDTADEAALRKLHANGTRALFLRCAGFDNVDLDIAAELKMPVMRVPAYSPHAIAEHAAALMMTLNRKIHRSFNRTRELNFRLDGLLGFDLHGKTVGVVGTGKIGALFARICGGFGCNVLAYDVVQSAEALSYGVKYVSLDEIWAQSDVISLHCPLFPSTRHVVNKESIEKMKDGVMIINTSRGGLIDTPALVRSLKSKKVGAVGLDVFEGEGDYFYEDRSGA
ncbi:hypothetical protein PybrP1_002080, partial [[Pythium] brassicae (nom. inval.)]